MRKGPLISDRAWRRLMMGLAAAAALVVWMQSVIPPADRDTPDPPRPARETGTRNPVPGWQTLRGCTLIDSGGNDGDSFSVNSHAGRKVVRLYFVDCPETKRYPDNGDRLAAQGKAFGGLTEEQTLAAGAAAKEFARKQLEHGPFTVVTEGEQVFDSTREYAFVITSQGHDLAELLVSEGLARIHTKGAAPPGGPGLRQTTARLRELEANACRQRKGAWAASRAPDPPHKSPGRQR